MASLCGRLMIVGSAFDVTQPRYSTAAAAYIARVFAERNMVDQVTVWRPKAPVLEDDGTLEAQIDFFLWIGVGRVWVARGPLTMGVGDEPSYYSQTFCSIPLVVRTEPDVEPAALSPRVDDIVKVTVHRDPLMVGRYFRVVDVESGGLLPSCRRMQLVGIQASKQWGGPDVPPDWVV